MWVLDLCSGLGGASEAFANHPLWAVVRIENNEKIASVPHTRLLDVNHWMDWLPSLILEMGCKPSFIIAAPPCTDFSTAYQAPRMVAERAGIPFEPDMEILESCIEIIGYCKPDFWIIENVIGSIPFFHDYVGKPTQIVGPFVFYGPFPYLDLNHTDFKSHKADNDTWSDDPLRANKKAKWPIEISQELLEVVSSQSTLSKWC
jgi:hypothetical protein